MGVKPKSFAGQDILIPGSYTNQNFPASPGANRSPSRVVAVIGETDGGIPYNASAIEASLRVNRFRNPADAQRVLRGGNGYYMAEFFLTPTRDETLAKPTEVLVFDPRPKTVGQSILQASAVNKITLTTIAYGVTANDFSRKVEAGTTTGKKFTLRYKGDVLDVRDNIAETYFTILYTGAAATATMTIGASGLTTSCAATPADDLTIDFTNIKKIGDLVSIIDGHESYTAILTTRSDKLTTEMDVATAVDIKTGTYSALANVQALIDHVNGNLSKWITAELVASATRVVPDNDASFIAFTGGTVSSATNTDWSGTLDIMKLHAINHVLVASGDPVKHGLVTDFCIAQSAVKVNEYVSSSSGASDKIKTVAVRIAECRAINSARFSYHFTPFTRRDFINDGETREFEPFYFAALTAGIMYANDITISPTFQSVNVLALNETYDKTTQEQIISGGGSYAILDGNEYTVGHYLSTYQGSESLILNLPSMLRTSDQICRDTNTEIKARLKSLKRAPTEIQFEEIRTWLISSVLPEFVTRGWLTRSPNTGADPFTDVQFVVEGDSFTFRCRGTVPAPLHYGFTDYDFVVVGATD